MNCGSWLPSLFRSYICDLSPQGHPLPPLMEPHYQLEAAALDSWPQLFLVY